MAKAHSPVRLQKELMDAAVATGQLMHRSAAEQIEFWATLGRGLSNQVSAETLLSLMTGAAKIVIEPVDAVPVDADAVFDSLERDRRAGKLSAELSSAAVKYQASTDHPGMLEQIAADGTVRIGQFANGEFAEAANR